MHDASRGQVRRWPAGRKPSPGRPCGPGRTDQPRVTGHRALAPAFAAQRINHGVQGIHGVTSPPAAATTGSFLQQIQDGRLFPLHSLELATQFGIVELPSRG